MGIEKICARIRKLLALAGNNPSPEEAAAAFAVAQELATKYALRLDDVAAGEVADERAMPTAEGMVTRRVAEWGKYVAWRGVVGLAVSEANLCGCYKTGDGLYFYGVPENVELASYMFELICGQVDAFGRDAARGKGRRYGRSFRIGCADTVRSRLRDSLGKTLREAAETTALARVERAKAYVEANTKALARKSREIGLGRAKGRAGGVSKDAYEAGRVAGHSVRFSGGTTRAIGGAS